MSMTGAWGFGLLMLLILGLGRSSSTKPVVVATHPAATTRRGSDPLTGLLIFILLLLTLLDGLIGSR